MKRLDRSVSPDEVERFIPTLKPIKKSNGVEVRKVKWELRYEAKNKLTKRLAASLVRKCSLYALRHSFATHALERGVDSITVLVLMGHSDPSMLAKVYQHLSQNPKYMLEQVKRAKGQI